MVTATMMVVVIILSRLVMMIMMIIGTTTTTVPSIRIRVASQRRAHVDARRWLVLTIRYGIVDANHVSVNFGLVHVLESRARLLRSIEIDKAESARTIRARICDELHALDSTVRVESSLNRRLGRVRGQPEHTKTPAIRGRRGTTTTTATVMRGTSLSLLLLRWCRWRRWGSILLIAVVVTVVVVVVVVYRRT